jgi:hypothetical protein
MSVCVIASLIDPMSAVNCGDSSSKDEQKSPLGGVDGLEEGDGLAAGVDALGAVEVVAGADDEGSGPVDDAGGSEVTGSDEEGTGELDTGELDPTD